MIRCKLISPTNLLLERPMLQPVKEVEYFVVGVKEHRRHSFETFVEGVLIGAILAPLVVVLLAAAFKRL